jgi:hypothetical protein
VSIPIPRPESPVVNPTADAFVRWAFSKIHWIAKLKRAYPKSARLLVLLACGLIAHTLWRYPIEPLVSRFGFGPESNFYFYSAARIAAQLLLGAIAIPILTFGLQLLMIAQRSIAAYELGLCWLSSTGGDINHLVSWFLHGHPGADRIRVICISGSHLFGSETEGLDSPLRPWAERGLLDVVMPVSSPRHPTVLERHKRYRGELEKLQYPDANALVEEIKRGKAYLRSRGNTVTEHNILCMWRVIILQNYCLVQNYFPNLSGRNSDHAPTFVYKNTGKDSYYQAYLEMFSLVNRHPGQSLDARCPVCSAEAAAAGG